MVEYRDGPWYYRDRYFGPREFLGMDVVNRDGQPVWGMHSHRVPTAAAVDHDAEYAFLRDALAAASIDTPTEGPTASRTASARIAWRSMVLPRFSGTERIVAGDIVSRGRFAGGTIE